MSDLRADPKWLPIRQAIKAELVDDNMDYPKGWSGGWLVPGSDNAADGMLDRMTDAVLAAIAEK